MTRTRRPTNVSGPPADPPHDALARFHPQVAAWFVKKFHKPTPVQEMAWEKIAAGDHILATAPTGSGKTLAAFLWALDRLITGTWPAGKVAIVYVSPLKALNADVQRNLLEPLGELQAHFKTAGLTMPELRVQTRSGDTPAAERARMLRKPPEILITTPESLNLLLTTRGGRAMLSSTRALILDEIHAVAAGKRGTWLMSAVERLALLAGEFQRVALSATVRPLEVVAEMVGGLRPVSDDPLSELVPRPVTILRAPGGRPQELRVQIPSVWGSDGDADKFWTEFAKELKGSIGGNRSTLFFTNSRRMSERLARLFNVGEDQPFAYAHHGSLARHLRTLVEERLKQGLVKALVATGSLELGIDIGALDEVVLVQCPRSLNACIQRLGRAGHRINALGRGRMVVFGDRDLLAAAVVAPLALAGAGEALRPPENPLDVLAQALVAMVGPAPWQVDELFQATRRCWHWRHLPRAAFDLVMDMLCGRHHGERLREAAPRLRFDRVRGMVTVRPGALALVWRSGGVIPDRGYFKARILASGAALGDLDEEFVWERRPGDEFAIGNQTWRIVRITHDAVEVAPGRNPAAMAPFWRAELEDRELELAEKIGAFLDHAEDALGTRAHLTAFLDELEHQNLLDPAAATALVAALRKQREATGRLPGNRTVIAETTPDLTRPGRQLLLLHACWGGRVIRPFAIALAGAVQAQTGVDPGIASNDDCLRMELPPGLDAQGALALLGPGAVERLLRARLERTGYFGARFRENAARALLLPRSDPRRRIPLWLTRMRAKKLLQEALAIPDFPLVVETWRTCLQDGFDLAGLERLLAAMASGDIAIHYVTTDQPSPFARDLVWMTTNTAMYADDTPDVPVSDTEGAASATVRRLLGPVGARPDLPPGLLADVAGTFRAKLQRTAPGYAPIDAEAMAETVEERLLITATGWSALLDAWRIDQGAEADAPALVRSLGAHLLAISPPDSPLRLVVAAMALPRLLAAWACDLAALKPAPLDPEQPDQVPAPGRKRRFPAAWTEAAAAPVTDAAGDPDHHLRRCIADHLRTLGPVAETEVAAWWGLDGERAESIFSSLAEDGSVVRELFAAEVLRGADGGSREAVETASGKTAGNTAEIATDTAAIPGLCDAEHYARLLRLARAARRPAFTPLPLTALPSFLAHWHGMTARRTGIDALQAGIEKLFGFAAPVATWEGDLLPARIAGYQPAWLDSLLSSSELMWYGAGRERIGFCFTGDLGRFTGTDPVVAAPQRRGKARILRAPMAFQTRSVEPAQQTGPGVTGPGAAGTRDFQLHSDHQATVVQPDDPRTAAGKTAKKPKDDDLAESAAQAVALLPDAEARYDFFALQKSSGLSTAVLTERLWHLAWAGLVVNDGFPALRQGMANNFAATHVAGIDHARLRGWQASRPVQGTWRRVAIDIPADGLARMDRDRDRVRTLIARYAVIFRELLAHESPQLSWGRLLPALRLMELAGELVTGQFFTGLQGLQFTTPDGWRKLTAARSPDAVWWCAATDPVSGCGLGLPGLAPLALPSRLAGTVLIYRGDEPALILRRSGRQLDTRLPYDHPGLPACIAVMADYLGTSPLRSLNIETIDDEPATASGHALALMRGGFQRDMRSLMLRRDY